MDIWIDIETGTWGDVDDLRIITDASPILVSSLNESSNTEIIEAGFDYGDTLEDVLETL